MQYPQGQPHSPFPSQHNNLWDAFGNATFPAPQASWQGEQTNTYGSPGGGIQSPPMNMPPINMPQIAPPGGVPNMPNISAMGNIPGAPMAAPGQVGSPWDPQFDWAGQSNTLGVDNLGDSINAMPFDPSSLTSGHASIGNISGTPGTTPPVGRNWFEKAGGLEGVGAALQGIAGIGNMWTGMKGLSLAKKQFRFNKDAYNTDLQNQYQDLNRRLGNTYRDSEMILGGSTGASSQKDYLNEHGFGEEYGKETTNQTTPTPAEIEKNLKQWG